MILVGLLACHSLGTASDAKSAWWNQEYPLRVEVEVKVPAPLCTEQPIAVPIDWPAGAAKGLELDWRYGKAIEITDGEAKDVGYCQRSSVVNVEAASVKAPPENPLAKKEQAPQQTYHLTFILPPRKDAPVRKCPECGKAVRRVIGAVAGFVRGSSLPCNDKAPCCGAETRCDKRSCEMLDR